MHFFHDSGKKAPSVPGFYLHIAPGECFAAAGIWHPDPKALAKVRDAIVSGSAEWKSFKRSKLTIEGGTLKRPPRGYPCEHPDMDDLKRTDFVTSVKLRQEDLGSKSFMTDFAAHCRRMSPLVKFVTRSLGMSW